MHYYILLFSILFFIHICVAAEPSKIILYRGADSKPIEIIGNECPFGVVFNEDDVFTCACLTGLWAFYDSQCSKPSLIAGGAEEKCVTLGGQMKIKKVHLLSSPDGNDESVAIFSDKMKTAKIRLIAGDYFPEEEGGLSLVTSGTKAWGLPISSSCLSPNQVGDHSNYCIYDVSSLNSSMINGHCKDNATQINPNFCSPLIDDLVLGCPDVQKPQNMALMAQNMALNKALDPTMEENNDLDDIHRLDKREDNNTSASMIILGLYDEDKNLTMNITHPEMNSQIWNYLTTRAKEMLNLLKPIKKTIATPTFKFLEISKQIMQKACPEHYVNNGHFDMALSTFSNLQTKLFKFKDEFIDFAAAERIEDSLNLCLNSIQKYPFIEPKTMIKNGTCNQSIEMGTFDMFGTWEAMNLTMDESSRENEPIIETVWRIFTHAHAACYKYFEDSFNDHHRYTTAVIPTFTNEINDVWSSMKELSSDTYSGLLGDASKLMDGVAYCAEYSKLQSEYPWDLPRPEKDLSNIRTKRSIDFRFSCLKESYDNTC